MADFIGYAIFIGWGLLIYYIPAYLAFKGNHKSRRAILCLNAFAGFTLVGWVGALVWSQTNDKEEPGYKKPEDESNFVIGMVLLATILQLVTYGFLVKQGRKAEAEHRAVMERIINRPY